jgi:hypothetical protein
MTEPPASVIEAAREWCRQRSYDPGGNFRALFVPKEDDLNSPEEERDLWHIFFYPEAMKKFERNYFLLVVDPRTLQVEKRL